MLTESISINPLYLLSVIVGWYFREEFRWAAHRDIENSTRSARAREIKRRKGIFGKSMM